tara:strand:+ start:27 stop:695 length:669 start_codon:yes stop_codon:yes gene_type:complete
MSYKMANVITIDGLASSGKTSISRKLSKKLGYYFLDSGILYRAVAYICLTESLDQDTNLLIANLKNNLEVVSDKKKHYTVNYKGNDLSDYLYNEEIGVHASIVSQKPEIREYLMRLQHNCVEPPGLVANGRDMGSKVFPDADFKLFIKADLVVRAKRRFKQLSDAGKEASLDKITSQLAERDKNDTNRKISPLIAPPGSIEIDSSHLNVDRILDKILELYKI